MGALLILVLNCYNEGDFSKCGALVPIEIINNKARHNLIDAKFRRRSDRLDGAGSFWEPFGETKVI